MQAGQRRRPTPWLDNVVIPETTTPRPPRWLTRGVLGVGLASLLADAGHEVPTALLPSFLTALGAPAAALGVIEGLADGAAGAARLFGGALADDPERRRRTALGGYVGTALLAALIGVTSAVWQAGMLRVAAWTARGVRVPARNALLADLTGPETYGRAYGFERAMDNIGAIVGPLLALGLVFVVGVRDAILISIVPGLLAAASRMLGMRCRPQCCPRDGIVLNMGSTSGWAVTGFGVVARTFMMVMYALERRNPWFVLAFAVGCLLSSAYGFLSGAWPFGAVELIWSGVAVRRYMTVR